MRVAVVGGAGFIGSHLVDRLLAEGHHVAVVDDLRTGALSNLADARAVSSTAQGGALKIHHLDALSGDADTLFGLTRPEIVYQLSLFPREDRAAMSQGRGFEMALATMEAARRHGVAKVVTTLPASSLYGQPAVSALPVKEAELQPRGVRGVVARAVVDVMATYRERDMIEFSKHAWVAKTNDAARAVVGDRRRRLGCCAGVGAGAHR